MAAKRVPSEATFTFTADPSEFPEAVNEFAKRRIVTRAEADGMADYAKRRAWWISGIAQMDVVNDVHASLKEAIRKGTSFDDWQREIGPKLEAAWGRKDSARILLIFRNATTQAYNAGRWEQMQQPAVKRMRPFVQYDVVFDTRTSDICRPLKDVVLPIDDPFVLTHNPPLHHQCRTGLVSLRKTTAERKGVTTEPPKIDVTPGFGQPPTLATPPLPSERTKPPAPAIQVEAAKKGAEDLKKRKPVAVKIEPKTDPTYWANQYREKYGDAADAVGYGRAMLERAKAMSAKEAFDIMGQLERERVPGIPAMAVNWLEKAAKSPSKIKGNAELEQKVEAMKLLAQIAKQHGCKLDALQDVPSDLKYATDKAKLWYEKFASSRVRVPNPRWKLLENDRDGRAYADVRQTLLALDGRNTPGDAVHEWAHCIEFTERLGRAIQPFKRAREAGKPLVSMSSLYAGTERAKNFNETEIGRDGGYWDPYMGREYGYSNVTEIMSQIMGDVAGGSIAAILANDPESLFLIIGILGGRF